MWRFTTPPAFCLFRHSTAQATSTKRHDTRGDEGGADDARRTDSAARRHATDDSATDRRRQCAVREKEYNAATEQSRKDTTRRAVPTPLTTTTESEQGARTTHGAHEERRRRGDDEGRAKRHDTFLMGTGGCVRTRVHVHSRIRASMWANAGKGTRVTPRTRSEGKALRTAVLQRRLGCPARTGCVNHGRSQTTAALKARSSARYCTTVVARCTARHCAVLQILVMLNTSERPPREVDSLLNATARLAAVSSSKRRFALRRRSDPCGVFRLDASIRIGPIVHRCDARAADAPREVCRAFRLRRALTVTSSRSKSSSS